ATTAGRYGIAEPAGSRPSRAGWSSVERVHATHAATSIHGTGRTRDHNISPSRSVVPTPTVVAWTGSNTMSASTVVWKPVSATATGVSRAPPGSVYRSVTSCVAAVLKVTPPPSVTVRASGVRKPVPPLTISVRLRHGPSASVALGPAWRPCAETFPRTKAPDGVSVVSSTSYSAASTLPPARTVTPGNGRRHRSAYTDGVVTRSTAALSAGFAIGSG